MATSELNRRQHERVSINANYRLVIAGQEYHGMVKNISFKGALLTMPESAPMEDSVSQLAELEIMTNENEWLSFKCKIVYISTPEQEQDRPVGIGVFFLDHDQIDNRSSSPATPQSNSVAKVEVKIVIVGNVGSGKSTAIRVISEVPVIGTEAKATETDTLRHKETTTVCMEYGVTHLDSTKLYLYGAPGQLRFDFMADILCTGAKGMVILIDHGCADAQERLNYYLTHHRKFLSAHACVIGITHTDDNENASDLTAYQTCVEQQGYQFAVLTVDAREKQDIQKLLINLLEQIN